MVKVVGPVLDACYPPAIVLAIYFCAVRKTLDARNLTAGKWAMISAFIISILEMLVRYSDMFTLGWDGLSSFYNRLPFAGYSLAWLPVCLVVYAALFMIRRSE
jgi:branched-subunit amino acid permease